MLSNPLSHGANTSMRQVGPSARPWRGQVRRSVHGVRMRPMKYTLASARGGRSTASSPERTSFSRTIDRSLVEADHHVGRLDDGVGRLADFQAELIDRLVGDRGRDGGATHIEPDMRGGRAFLDFDDLALEPVPGADLHGASFRLLTLYPFCCNAAVALHQNHTTIWTPLEQAKVSISTLPAQSRSDTIAIFTWIYRSGFRMTATLRLDPWTLHLRNGAANALRGRPLGVLPPRMIEPELTEQLARVSRRTKIWELSNHLHCSIVGTCLSTGELRQVLSKAAMTVAGASDHDLHGQGVLLANLRDGRGKLLHKALDKRHRLAIGRFEKAKTIDEVRALWRDAVKQGDIPGGYWAALTHPATNDALIREIFGEVHMLSHLVGAANRADIRRLSELEAENVALQVKLRRQQEQLREGITSRDATIRDINALLARR